MLDFDWYDWTEYERLIGEFIRTYNEGEAVKVSDKLKTQTGIATNLLQQQKLHRIIRNLLIHGGHALMAKGDGGNSLPPRDSWYPCSMPISFVAQSFLGLGYKEPVTLLNNKRDLKGSYVDMKKIKDSIAKMRLSAIVATAAFRVGRWEKKEDSRGRRFAAINLHPNIEIPLVHVTRDYDSERSQSFLVARYDETAQELGTWRDIDQVVGAFLRAWSEILVCLRELEIMMVNPRGPSSRMNLGSAATDMKRAEKVLGSSHPVTRELMDVSKERALIVHGDRTVEGVVDQSFNGEGGVYLCSVRTIESYIEPLRFAVKEVCHIVDERRAKWGVCRFGKH